MSTIMSNHDNDHDGHDSSQSIHEEPNTVDDADATTPTSEWVLECYKLEVTATINTLVDKHEAEMSALKATFHAELNALHHEIAELKQNRQHIDTTHPVDFYQETIRALIQKFPSPAAVAPPAVAPAVAPAGIPAAAATRTAAAVLASAASPPNPANKRSKPPNTHPSSANQQTTTAKPPAPPSSNSTARKNVIIVGDSMLKGVDSYKTSRKTFRVTTQVLSGGTIGEIDGVARALATRSPHAMILHVGTNDLYPKSGSDTQDSTRSPRTEKEVADEINTRVTKLEKDFPGTKFIVSKLITREDKGSEGVAKVKNVNSFLAKCKHPLIENTNIMASHLNGSKLHLKQSGNVQLAVNFANYLNTIC